MRHVSSPRLATLLALAALGGCQPASTDDDVATRDAETGALPPAPVATGPAPLQPEADRPALMSEAARGETGARALLLDWARALENGDLAAAHTLLGDASSMSATEYMEYWSGFGRLTVAVPEGRMEGAAGSLYYEVPATVTAEMQDGRTATWQGPLILRRVNDVPGASREELNWHFESADLGRRP